MQTHHSSVLPRVVYAIACMSSAVYIALYVAIASLRLSYPYELEWFEGVALDIVRRILAGEPIYVAPSIDFIPYTYAPIYFHAGATLSTWLGVGFLPLRILSFTASIGCLVLIFLFVRREARCASCGLVGAGFFAACFRFSGAWYDLARVDSLSLLFLLASVFVLRSWSRIGAAIAAGLLGVLAFFTKQNALPTLLALCAYTLYVGSGSRRFGFPLTVAAGLVSVCAVLDRTTSGWFSYYTLQIPGQGTLPHHIRWLMQFWLNDVPTIAIAVVGALAGIRSQLRRREFADLSFYAPLFAAMLFSSWSARVHAGGYDNALMMIDAWLAIAAAVAFHELVAQRSALLVGALAIVQLALLAYDPSAQIPSTDDVRAGNQLVERLRQIPGDVLVANHPYLGVLAGKPAHAHLDLVNTIPRGTENRRRLDDEIEAAIAARRFAAIVLDRRKDRYYRRRITADLESFYEYRGSIIEGEAFWPVTGLATRPQDLYLRR